MQLAIPYWPSSLPPMTYRKLRRFAVMEQEAAG